MVAFKRTLVAACAMFITFIGVFLAIFVPLLLRDMHYAPHDGQDGMGGFFLGLPVALIAALVIGATSYMWMAKRRWFERSRDNLEN
jgi:hypothetical protein